MKILVFAGTTEGRRIAEYLNDTVADSYVSVATEYGGRLLEEYQNLHLLTGRMDEDEITAFLSEKEIDLKPLILQYAFSKEEFEMKNGSSLPELNHEYDSEDELYLKLVSGSATNIKPELVLEAYMNHLNLNMKPFSYQVHRIQMYFDA